MFANLQRHIRRGENVTRKISISIYSVVGLIMLGLGYDTAALICLVGFVHETTMMEIGALRREIRFKRMWNEGQ